MMTMLRRIRIIGAFLVLSGITYSTQATISVDITSIEPKTGFAFVGDVIRLTCEAASDDTEAPNITWYLHDVLTPPIANSSFTKITSKIEGNKTIGILTTTTSIANGRPHSYIYCQGSFGSSTKKVYKYFDYVKERPRLQVKVPQTQAMAEGTRRHVLVCEVSSSVDVKSLTLYWIYEGQKLQENIIELKKGEPISRSILLQCLEEKDFGDYECAVNMTLYRQTWHNSATTTLKGYLLENTGTNINPSVIQLLCLSLILLGNIL